MPLSNKPVHRYLRRLAIASAIYVLAVFFTFHILWHIHVMPAGHGPVGIPLAMALAAIPSIPLVAVIVIVALYLKEEKDEFQRELFIQSLLWGMGATLAVTSFWSFLHIFAHVPAVDGFHVFVLFWLFTGLSALPLRRYYGGSGE